MSKRPGQWPVTEPADLDTVEQVTADELYVQRAAETALHEMVMDSIKHDLRQQPSSPCVQSAARAWCARITAAADDIAQAKRSTG
ncbi:hypothetical protein [Streptomyces sp. 2A115]|uniref:hypothetical protein n=1 Tax=Streptomyces sp. 2A115 TaxID=3457439 RepID=UPI003FD0EFC9